MKTRSIQSALIILIVLIILVQFPIGMSAQCKVTIPNDTIIACIGDTVMLQATGYCSSDTIFYDPFTTQMPAPEWSTILYFMAPPCPPHLPTTGSYVAWFDNAVSYPRWIVLNNIDLTTYSSTVYLSWDMKYGASVPNIIKCEPPDLPNEGVHIQFSTSPNNWVDIQYYTPSLGNAATGPLYSWNNYTLAVPAMALSASTSFRWYQDISSGHIFDHWGIDNPLIFNDSAALSSLGTYTWHVNGNIAGAGQTIPVTANLSANYSVIFSSGVDTAYDTVYVQALPPPVADLGNDTIVGLADSIVFDVSCLGCTYLWSTGATTPLVTIDTSVVGPGTHLIWVQVKRGMNCVSYDWTSVSFSPWASLGEAGRSRLSIYPNPGNGVLSVVFPDDLYGHYRLDILDAGMRTIRTIERDAGDQDFLNIDVGDIPSGMYYIRLISNEHCSTSPYIKH